MSCSLSPSDIECLLVGKHRLGTNIGREVDSRWNPHRPVPAIVVRTAKIFEDLEIFRGDRHWVVLQSVSIWCAL